MYSFCIRLQYSKMIKFPCFQSTIKHYSNPSITKPPRLINSFEHLLKFILLRTNQFCIEFSYFICLSLVGYGALKAFNTRTPSFYPRNIDMFFTSVSAATVSSMSTVEMEVFSNNQLIILTVLMFAGGEVFTSMFGLQLLKFKKTNTEGRENKVNNDQKKTSTPEKFLDQIELGVVSIPDEIHEEQPTDRERSWNGWESRDFSLSSIKLLSNTVLCYLLVVHIFDSSIIYIYTSFIPSAKQVLEKKGLNLITFAVFTTVSTFTNCGFVPTNENMIVFKNNSGLLLIMISQVLRGNTLYPACLRLVIWISGKISKHAEFTYMLKNSRKMGYNHLLPGLQTKLLAVTAFVFIVVQFILFCALEWHSEVMAGLNTYQKLVGSLFVVVNSRHAGESVFDLSMLTPAILVVFVVMMYLPPYTYFWPIEDDERVPEAEKNRKNIVENLLFSQLTYLVIFIIFICITERKKMKEDPLNFNLLSIVLEVISAYGNVGFSMGYSCGRQIKTLGNCKDAAYGFAGKWSDKGKFLLIAVMFFGRLKKFSAKGSKSWKFL